MTNKFLLIALSVLFFSCQKAEISYSYIQKSLAKHTNLIELSSDDGAQRILLSAEYQGRVITTTMNGVNGASLGYVNLAGLKKARITGAELHTEQRLWIGPLGGQYSFYYGQQKPLSEENWEVPVCFNAEAFTLQRHNKHQALFTKEMQLTNNSGNTLHLSVARELTLLTKRVVKHDLALKEWPQGVHFVAYQASTQLYNEDSISWTKERGLASIWDLNTYQGSDKSYVIIPVKDKNGFTTYLNTINGERLQRDEHAVIFKCDGKYRSKIGVSNKVSVGLLASYCPEKKLLRIIDFKQQRGDLLYFNSLVEAQENPYKGESISIYNHGPMDLSMAKNNAFYEMESTSPMKALKPGEYITHYHRVYQFQGDYEALNRIAKQVLGVALKDQ